MNWIVRADFPTPALNCSDTINSKRVNANLLHPLRQVYIVSRIEPMPGVNLCFQHEDVTSRPTLAVGVAAILTVCNQGGMGKGGKREEG